VSAAEAAAAARHAIEAMRLDRFPEQLRVGGLGPPAEAPGRARRFRYVLGSQLRKRVLRPAYVWGLERGLVWWEPLANQVNWLLRRFVQ
jgi:hypothetical protein